MNIVLAAAELAPYEKGGGMADVTGYLTIEWARKENQVVGILPLYESIDIEKHNIEYTGISFPVEMGFITEEAKIYKVKNGIEKCDIYLIGHEDFFQVEYLYGEEKKRQDEDRRFIFFSRAVPELIKKINFSPDVINTHDYHTGFIHAFLKTYYKNDEYFQKTVSVFTIHNLSYQGKFDPYRIMDFTGYSMKEFQVGSWFEHEGHINFMKTGIMYADKITTVSPTYAEEIKEPMYSEGLQEVISSRSGDIIGVLNGVFYEEWSPEKDKRIVANYSNTNIDRKLEDKKDLLNQFGFDVSKDLDTPIFGMVSRLSEHKGIDILNSKIAELLKNNNMILAVLGVGEERYEEFLSDLKDRYPANVLLRLDYSEYLAHKIMAGSDFILVPSRFEPCGLTQMYGLKYGTIPIVRNTGGLSDTVKEYSSEKNEGYGFVFKHYNPDDFEYAIKRALTIYKSEPHWNIIRENAMSQDNSSEKCAQKYIEVFKDTIDKFN